MKKLDINDIIQHMEDYSTYLKCKKRGNNMRYKTNFQTAWVIGICMVILVVWDILMWSNNITGDTISEVTIRNAIRHPIIPFIWGVIMGHLFWPQVATKDDGDV